MKATIEHRKAPWAVRPETLGVISKLIRGDVTAEDISAGTEGDHQATEIQALRTPLVTGGIAVLSLCGLITPRPSFLSMLFGGGGGLQGFRRSFHEAVNSDEISAILIDVDSPGGLVDLVPETAADIRAARGSKPIVAIADTMAASAAYWIASQADELVVTPSGEVGSIGVFMAHEDWSKFDEELGVKTTLISAGRFKTEGNPYEPLTEEAQQAFQETVNELYGMFVSDVAKGRGATVNAVKAGYGEGRMLTAKRAVEGKMADRVDTLEGTIERLVKRPPRARSASVEDGASTSAIAAEVARQMAIQTEALLAATDTLTDETEPAAPAEEPEEEQPVAPPETEPEPTDDEGDAEDGDEEPEPATNDETDADDLELAARAKVFLAS